MFFRGRKSDVEVKVRAKAATARHYRLNVRVDRTPGVEKQKKLYRILIYSEKREILSHFSQ